MPQIEPLLQVTGFRKVYRDVPAVDDLSFNLAGGEILGLVGANGAGKTTTLRALATLSRPPEGTVKICGLDVATHPLEARRIAAYVPDTFHPYPTLTVQEHLHFMALAYGVPPQDRNFDGLLAELDLTEKADCQASALSRGMLQKLALACAFIRRPELLVLDEPLTGLDPRALRTISRAILRRSGMGMGIILSSHLLPLVESICHKILILHLGRSVAFGTLCEIRRLASQNSDANLERLFFAITDEMVSA